MTKNKIVLITMAALLVALVVVYFLFVAPLLNTEVELPTPQDGEGIFGTRLTVYEPITQDQLVSINVKNKKGEFTFITEHLSDGKKKVYLEQYKDLEYDRNYYAYLLSYALNPSSADNEPFRGLTDEQMKEYGVTPDTCQATMKVTFKDKDGTEKTHTLRIGHPTFTASTTYYVSIDGRNSVYRFSAAAETCILIGLEEYIAPIVYVGDYENSAMAMIDITRLFIFKNDGATGTSKPLVVLTGTPFVSEEGTASTKYTLFITNEKGEIVKNTLADTDYVINAIDLFYTKFYGDLVVEISPDEATLDAYGLGKNDITYLIDAYDTDGKQIHSFVISDLIYDEELKAKFSYTLAYQAGVPLLVRIPEQALIPQNQFKDKESPVFAEDKLINWAATNTVGTGLREALQSDGKKYVGVKKITIRVPDMTVKGTYYDMFEETFNIRYEFDAKQQLDILKVTSDHGFYKDESNERIKEFNRLYSILISHPIPQRFNTMSEEDIAAKVADASNFMYCITVELNDGRVLKYEGYRISTEYVMMRCTEGKYVNGVLTMSETQTIFDTTRSQVTNYLYKGLAQLVNGETVSVK